MGSLFSRFRRPARIAPVTSRRSSYGGSSSDSPANSIPDTTQLSNHSLYGERENSEDVMMKSQGGNMEKASQSNSMEEAEVSKSMIKESPQSQTLENLEARTDPSCANSQNQDDLLHKVKSGSDRDTLHDDKSLSNSEDMTLKTQGGNIEQVSKSSFTEDVEVQNEREIQAKTVTTDPYNECKSLFAKLKTKENEKFIREKVAHLLKSWDTSGKLAELEKSVDNISDGSTCSIADLARSLKGENFSEHELGSSLRQIELAYKVYCWVTKNIRYDEQCNGVSDPDKVLKMKKAVCHGYTTLFRAIATNIGLKVTRVDGSYRDMKRCWSLNDSDSHTWNLVTIENIYFPVDCTHGSGYSIDGKFQQCFTNVYFFPNPEHLIITHWVQDEELQLLEHPLDNITALQKLVVIPLDLFSKKIMPEVLCQCINLPSNSSSVQVFLTLNSNVNFKFSALLKQKVHGSEEVVVHSNDNSLSFIELNERRVIINTVVPKSGSYCLDIYTEEKDCINGGKTNCLSYDIVAEHDAMDSEFIGYPKVSEIEAAMCDFSIINIDEWCKFEEKVIMTLKARDNATFSHFICEGKLSDSDIQPNNKLWCYTNIVKDECKPNYYKFTAMLPSIGWWTLFLINIESNDKSYVLMRYQVFATVECKDKLLYPYVTDATKELSISLQDEVIPVSFESRTHPIAVKFTALYGLDYKVKLIEISENEETSQAVSPRCSTYISLPHQGQCMGCIYAITPPGLWNLEVYANEICKETLKHVLSVKPIQGSEAMINKIFPQISPNFLAMSLAPPVNIESWMLPAVVNQSECPKNIKVHFNQKSSEVQLFCMVERDNQKLNLQNVATLKKLSQQNEDDTVIFNRVIDICISEKGEWKFTLEGRYLHENKTVSTLLEYVVKIV